VLGCAVLGVVIVVTCAAYGRERRLLPSFRLPGSEKPGQNSNLEQATGFRYAEIDHFAPKNL
jgi:hypothetical protein